MDLSSSLSITSALSGVPPPHEKLYTFSHSSTLSANHSCKPAGVAKNSYNIAGEHLTGNSSVNSCFLLITISLVYNHRRAAIIIHNPTLPNVFLRQDKQ